MPDTGAIGARRAPAGTPMQPARWHDAAGPAAARLSAGCLARAGARRTARRTHTHTRTRTHTRSHTPSPSSSPGCGASIVVLRRRHHRPAAPTSSLGSACIVVRQHRAAASRTLPGGTVSIAGATEHRPAAPSSSHALPGSSIGIVRVARTATIPRTARSAVSTAPASASSAAPPLRQDQCCGSRFGACSCSSATYAPHRCSRPPRRPQHAFLAMARTGRLRGWLLVPTVAARAVHVAHMHGHLTGPVPRAFSRRPAEGLRPARHGLQQWRSQRPNG